jgi:hypothetical protein
MKKAKRRGQPQDVVVHELADAKSCSHNQVVETAKPSKAPEPPTHPALSFWDINRKLKKLEESYRRDQEEKPAEIESSSVGNPQVAAIFWRVKRLKQYVEEIEAVYETEIDAGRFADTPGLWAGVYAAKILPSVSAKINSLTFKLGHKLWLTGGGGPGEQASVEEAQRELSRLRARLECELATAASQAEEATGQASENARPTSGHNTASSANERESCMRPLLERKGWSTHDWAIQSKVDFHTASDYLKGKTNPYASTRAKLAESLDIDVADLAP